MNFLKDMLEVLESAGLGIEGETLFAGVLPADGLPAVGVFEYAGQAPDRLAHHRRPGLQVLVREADYRLGRAKIEAVHTILRQLEVLEGIEGVRYLKLESVQEPSPLGQDANGMYLFVQNFIVTYFEEV
jgi:hypothetical protein